MNNPKKAGEEKLLDSIKELPALAAEPETDYPSTYKLIIEKYAARIAQGPDIGYEINNNEDYGWTARKNAFSGSIFAVTDGRYTASGKFKATAMESDTARFSTIQQGKKGNSLLEKGSAGLPSIWLYMLAIMSYPERPEFLREQMIDTLMSHPNFHMQRVIFDKRHKDKDGGSTPFDYIKKYIGERITFGIEVYGSPFLFDVAELSRCIEKKEYSTNKEERDFLEAVSSSTDEVEKVPFQKEVKLLWLQGREGRTEEHFRRVRNKLGFSWLPTGTRGKSAR